MLILSLEPNVLFKKAHNSFMFLISGSFLDLIAIPLHLFAGSCGKIVTPYSCCLGDAGSCGATLPPEAKADSYGATSPFYFEVGSCVITSCSFDSSWMGAR